MTAPVPQPAPAARRRSTRWVGYTIAGTLIFLMVGAYVTLLFGRVAGSEFSPEAFERREFQYWQIPLVDIQVSAIQREKKVGRLEDYLFRNNFVTPQPARTWDLIQASEGAEVVDPRGASILVDYLEAHSPEGANYWESWSTVHPVHAQRLWPQFVQLARRRLYTLLPDLMHAARRGTAVSGDEFQRQMHRTLASGYKELAALALQTGSATEAQRLEKWGREHAAAAKRPLPEDDAKPDPQPTDEP